MNKITFWIYEKNDSFILFDGVSRQSFGTEKAAHLMAISFAQDNDLLYTVNFFKPG